jgi:hypothetical protein
VYLFAVVQYYLQEPRVLCLNQPPYYTVHNSNELIDKERTKEKYKKNNASTIEDLNLNIVERDLSRLMTLFKLRNPEGTSCSQKTIICQNQLMELKQIICSH